MNTISVNGLSCSYARLGTYSNCATQEKSVTPSPVVAPVKIESFDPSPTTLPGSAPSAVNYTPSYTVPNYAPVKPTLISAGNSCAGYPNVIDAYGKNAGNCVTNYINN